MPYTSTVLNEKTSKVLPWLVAVAFFMQMLDGTILNTALPGIARDLNVPTLRMQSVVIAYMLTTALLMPVSGFLADRLGTRKVFNFAILVFTLGSLLCALSPTLNLLVGARIVQGIGGALLVPVGRLVVLKAYPRAQLVQVLSFVTLPGLIGPLMGPMLGGFLVQYASWHWIFLINIPVGILGFILAVRCMPDLRSEKPHKFDGLGFLLFSISMILISLAMEGFGELHLPKVESSLMVIGGLLFLSVYWFRAMHLDDPLFSPHLFKTRSFSVGILGNLFSRLGSGAMPFLTPLFLQLGLGFSPFRAGLTMIPSALAAIVGKQLINGLLKRFGFRLFLAVNTSLIGIMLAMFAVIDAGTPYWVLLTILAVFGIINSMQFTAMNSLTLIDLSNEEAGSGNSLLSVTMQISATAGVALGAAFLSGFSALFGATPSPEEEIKAFHYTFLVLGGLSLGTTLIFLQTPKDTGRVLAEKKVPTVGGSGQD